jgi:hypothetical protein
MAITATSDITAPMMMTTAARIGKSFEMNRGS